MASQAVVSLVGHCTQPELKVLQDGTEVVTFSLATNTYSKAGDITSWWRVSVFGRSSKGLVTLMQRGLFTKGTLVAVVGEVSQRQYTANDGSQRMSVDVRAYDAEVCLPPKGSNQADGENDMNEVPY